MSTTGHESEAINVSGLKASLKKGGNIGLYNEAICSTAGGTAAKVTNTTPPSFTLTAGAKILVKFTYAISAENATLQVGSNSAKPIYYKGYALPADLVKAGTSLLLSYDGTSFNIVGDLNTDTTYSTMGASGSTHSGGLVPDTPSTAGTTKYLREDGTWQVPEASYNLPTASDSTLGGVKVGSNLSIDNNGVLNTSPEKLGNGIGTCSTSSGTALAVTLSGYELVQNGFVAVTFENDVPAGATLNVNSKGAKAIIYKGSSITADTIKADDTALFSYDGTNYILISSGGSGGSVLPETVTINLTSTESNDSNLIGLNVTVVNYDTQETILTRTWDGTPIYLVIAAGTTYTVTSAAISGYTFNPPQRTVMAVSGRSLIITMQYMAESIDLGLPSGTLWCSHNVGATNIYDRGLFFAWGKTTGYAFDSGHNFNYEGEDFSADLSYSYDAAYTSSSGKFRMPSNAEFTELKENTDIEIATIGGMSGLKFMKKTDHSIYIFLPAAGRIWITNTYDNIIGYWTKTHTRYYLYSDPLSTTVALTTGTIADGRTIRGVKV